MSPSSDSNRPETPPASTSLISGSKKRPPSRGTAAYPRKRAVTACQTCRARRTKCDNLKPKCSFCLKTGASCVQSPVDLSSFDPASLHIIHRLNELETSLHAAIRDGPRNDSPTQQRPATTEATTKTLHLEQWRILPPEPEQVYNAVDGVMPQRSIVATITARDSYETSPMSQSYGGSVEAEVDGRTCRRLLDAFFNYVHVKNPILVEDTTRRIVNHISMIGLDWSPQSCLTLLICALGSLATPFGNSEAVAHGSLAYATSNAYFEAARKRLGLCLIDGGLLGAQVLFLAGVHLMNIFRPFEAWRMFSQSLACCQSFDFTDHDDAQTTSPSQVYSHPEEAARQSIYWTAWKSEQELRISLGLRDFSATITSRPDSLYPIFFPTPPVSSPEGLDMDEAQARERQAWYFYLTEISLKRLYQRVAQETLHFQPLPGQSVYGGLARAVPSKQGEVEDWQQALPSTMSLSTDPEDDDICKFVLRGHLHNYYEMIYWPFVAKLIMPPPPSSSHSSNADDFPEVHPTVSDHDLLKKLAERGLALHVERIRVNAPGFKHRHHGTWGMIRSCCRSALVLVSAALVIVSRAGHDAIPVSLPAEWRSAVLQVVDMARYWQAEALDAQQHVAVLEHGLALL